MIFWLLSQLQSIVSALHSKDSPRQLAAGFALGSFVGWVPFNVFYSFTIMAVLYLVNVNLGFGLLGILLTSLLSFGLDPLAGKVGTYVLTQVAWLKPMWSVLYNLPLIPYTRFNNTVMMGSMVLAVLGAIPLYFLILWAVGQYRLKWKTKIEQWRVIRWILGTKWVVWCLNVKAKF